MSKPNNVNQTTMEGKSMQSEWSQGAAYARDLILSNIIAMQNGLNCKDGTNPKYGALQELLEHIVQSYGDFCKPFKG